MAGGIGERQLRSAYTEGLRALARRERSTVDLRRWLLQRGHAPGDVDLALSRLAEHGALDDRRAAAALARRHARLGRSTMRIRAELTSHGFERDVIREVLDATLGDSAHDLTALARTVERLAPTLSSPESVLKTMQRLRRRGFELSAIRAALARVSIAAPDDAS